MKAVLFHTDKNILALSKNEVSPCQKKWTFQTLTYFGLVGTRALWSFRKALGARHDLTTGVGEPQSTLATFQIFR